MAITDDTDANYLGNLPRLDFLSPGTVRIRCQRSQQVSHIPILRHLRSLCDRQWTWPLLVGVFLVHHQEGIFLFDTGQSPYCNNPGYFPRAALFNKVLRSFKIEASAQSARYQASRSESCYFEPSSQ